MTAACRHGDALGGRSPERALAIMRDSRAGAYGVVAVALVLVVEAAALREVVAAQRVAATACAFAVSRALAPPIAALFRTRAGVMA